MYTCLSNKYYFFKDSKWHTNIAERKPTQVNVEKYFYIQESNPVPLQSSIKIERKRHDTIQNFEYLIAGLSDESLHSWYTFSKLNSPGTRLKQLRHSFPQKTPRYLLWHNVPTLATTVCKLEQRSDIKLRFNHLVLYVTSRAF